MIHIYLQLSTERKIFYEFQKEEAKKTVDENKLKPINFEIPKNSFQPEQQTCKFIYEYLKNVFIDELKVKLFIIQN